MQLFYRKALAPMGRRCFELLFASSVRKALEIIESERSGPGVAYALLDWSLPDGTAGDVLDRLREREKSPRIMLVSALSAHHVVPAAASADMVDAVLAKPVGLRLLRRCWKHFVCPLSPHHMSDGCCITPPDPQQAGSPGYAALLPADRPLWVRG